MNKMLLSVLLVVTPWLAQADQQAVNALLNRIRQQGAAEFNYRETRILELATTPWQGEGVMLSDANGSLIKLQQQPNRIIMAIADQDMFYWDAQQQQRHRASLEQAGAAAEQIIVFRTLLQGQWEALQARYDLVAEQQDQHWMLRLTPKAELVDAPTIELSGDDEGKQRRLLIKQADGDTTEYQLSKINTASGTAESIQRLLLEASGE